MLRGIIQRLFGWPRKPVTDEEASRRLAADMGAPADEVARIFQRAADQVRALGDDADDEDAMRIMERAASHLQALPCEDQHEKLVRLLRSLPEPDRQILLLAEEGARYNEIAERLDMHEDAVLDAMLRIYARSLRMAPTRPTGSISSSSSADASAPG